LDEASFASCVASFLARLRFGIGHTACHNGAASDNDLPIPTTIAPTAGHDPKFNAWLRVTHGHSPDFLFGDAGKRIDRWMVSGRIRTLQKSPKNKGLQIEELRHNAFQAELAGMLEDEWAVVVVELLVKPQAGPSAHNQAGHRRFAQGKRIAAKIGAVQLDQVEDPEEDVVAMTPVAHAMPSSPQENRLLLAKY
jgi:hypothetical protein